jgi:hypothetical protein
MNQFDWYDNLTKERKNYVFFVHMNRHLSIYKNQWVIIVVVANILVSQI